MEHCLGNKQEYMMLIRILLVVPFSCFISLLLFLLHLPFLPLLLLAHRLLKTCLLASYPASLRPRSASPLICLLCVFLPFFFFFFSRYRFCFFTFSSRFFYVPPYSFASSSAFLLPRLLLHFSFLFFDPPPHVGQLWIERM